MGVMHAGVAIILPGLGRQRAPGPLPSSTHGPRYSSPSLQPAFLIANYPALRMAFSRSPAKTNALYRTAKPVPDRASEVVERPATPSIFRFKRPSQEASHAQSVGWAQSHARDRVRGRSDQRPLVLGASWALRAITPSCLGRSQARAPGHHKQVGPGLGWSPRGAAVT